MLPCTPCLNGASVVRCSSMRSRACTMARSSRHLCLDLIMASRQLDLVDDGIIGLMSSLSWLDKVCIDQSTSLMACASCPSMSWLALCQAYSSLVHLGTFHFDGMWGRFHLNVTAITLICTSVDFLMIGFAVTHDLT